MTDPAIVDDDGGQELTLDGVSSDRAALDDLIATGAPIGELIDRGDVGIDGDDGPSAACGAR
jgi:hypothetical protein